MTPQNNLGDVILGVLLAGGGVGSDPRVSEVGKKDPDLPALLHPPRRCPGQKHLFWLACARAMGWGLDCLKGIGLGKRFGIGLGLGLGH